MAILLSEKLGVNLNPENGDSLPNEQILAIRQSILESLSKASSQQNQELKAPPQAPAKLPGATGDSPA